MSTDQIVSGVSKENPFYENYKPGQPLVEVKIPELPTTPEPPDTAREIKVFTVTEISPESPVTWEDEPDAAPKVLTEIETETSSATTSTQQPQLPIQVGSPEPSVEGPSIPSLPTTGVTSSTQSQENTS